MKIVKPYKTYSNALAALDNGGRFYNLITQANDGNVTSAELGKLAGIFNDKQKMILFLEMSIFDLEDQAVKDLKQTLTSELKSSYQQFIPQRLVPSEAKKSGKLSANAIITGIPKHVSSHSDFNGFIFVPILAGKTMTMVLVPIIDQYDVYELRDQTTSTDFLIAHARGKTKLPEKLVRCGGMLKALKSGESKTASSSMFLETLYYSILG